MCVRLLPGRTAASAQNVSLVVALAEAGSSLGCFNPSAISWLMYLTGPRLMELTHCELSTPGSVMVGWVLSLVVAGRSRESNSQIREGRVKRKLGKCAQAPAEPRFIQSSIVLALGRGAT